MNNKEIAQRIVDRMLEAINAGEPLPWTKPWSTKGRSIKVTDEATTITVPVEHWSRSGKPYQGVNILLLNLLGKTGEMITFNQCKAEGGRIRKGAKAATIVYWNMVRKETEELDDDGNKKVTIIPVLKTYNVFSVEADCEGIEPKHKPEPMTVSIPTKWHFENVNGIDESAYNPAAESVIAGYLARSNGLKLERNCNSDRAFYRPSAHSITVPNISQFNQVEEFYSTLFHELGHSTGHASLLNRFSGKDAIAAFGSESYSREELVAEITAASVLNTLGLESGNSFRNSAAYVKGWSEKIKNDPMMFITAAGRAEKALALILGTDSTGGTTPPDAGSDPENSSDSEDVKIPEGYTATTTSAGNVIMVSRNEYAETENPEPKKANKEKKAFTRGQIAAMNRVVKGVKGYKEAWKGVVSLDSKSIILDGYRLLRLSNDPEELPRAECNGLPFEMDTLKRIIEKSVNAPAAAAKEELPLPCIDQLRLSIKEQKAAKIRTPLAFWSLEDGQLLGVNAQYLLDMMLALPGCKAYQPEKSSAPIYFSVGENDGILLPVRMAGKLGLEVSAA